MRILTLSSAESAARSQLESAEYDRRANGFITSAQNALDHGDITRACEIVAELRGQEKIRSHQLASRIEEMITAHSETPSMSHR